MTIRTRGEIGKGIQRFIGVAISILLMAACTTPTATPTPTPSPTIPPEPVGQSNLLRMMEKVPISWTAEGIWFDDWGRALEMAGAQEPHTIDEFLALSEAERQRHYQATRGLAFGPAIRMLTRDNAMKWREAFGFTYLQMDVGIAPGRSYSETVQPAYVEGEFDAATISERLLDLGYEKRQSFGRTYFTIRQDYGQDFNSPVRFAFDLMNRVYVDEGTLITSPATHMIEGILRVKVWVNTWTGEGPSVNYDPAFLSLGEALWDSLSAAILPRRTALDTSSLSHPPQLERQDGWGTLHEWEAVGFGYGREPDGSHWFDFSLFYVDPEAADIDALELVNRMETYETSVQEELLDRGLPEHPLQVCGAFSYAANRVEHGSTLTVRCAFKEDATPGAMWVQVIDMRDLGFLVP